MKDICKDLAAEYEDLDMMVKGLTEDQWDLIVPFGGWTVRDEISHLAYFDRAAFYAAADAHAFDRVVGEMMDKFVDFDRMYDRINREGNAKPAAELLAWWRRERSRLLAAFLGLDPKARLPWFGPPMGARSSATARLMETWAHGQDISDALGVARPPTERLRHIAHLGVATFAWSFQNRGMAVPEQQVRVVLESPGGGAWEWGPEGAENRVAGSALDFCLAAVRRRHYLDTGLEVRGDTARRWMEIIQAFAGPPEPFPAPQKAGEA